jgi:hypothetical protein
VGVEDAGAGEIEDAGADDIEDLAVDAEGAVDGRGAGRPDPPVPAIRSSIATSLLR